MTFSSFRINFYINLSYLRGTDKNLSNTLRFFFCSCLPFRKFWESDLRARSLVLTSALYGSRCMVIYISSYGSFCACRLFSISHWSAPAVPSVYRLLMDFANIRTNAPPQIRRGAWRATFSRDSAECPMGTDIVQWERDIVCFWFADRGEIHVRKWHMEIATCGSKGNFWQSSSNVFLFFFFIEDGTPSRIFSA